MTSKKEWTDDEVREEIKNAVRIVAEDREKARYLELHSRYGAKPEGEEGEESEETEDDSGTKPPPKKDKQDEQPKKKRSLWWAESDGDDE